MPTRGAWRAVSALAPPVIVTADGAPRQVSGHPVQAAAFVSATTGWTIVARSTPRPTSWLLRTDDAGATWASQLAWPGNIVGGLRAFDDRRAGLLLGLWPTFDNEINGERVAEGEPFYFFVATTQDGGATWTLASGPDRQGAGVHFLSTQQIWLLIHAVDDSASRTDLARTEDGGVTWSRIDGTGELPLIDVAFSSLTDGFLTAADRRRADTLFRTTDGGGTWIRQHLRPPAGLPRSRETWLFPVLTPVVGDLLTLRAVSRRESTSRPAWEGTYAYISDGDGWTSPHRLPMPPAPLGRDLLAPGPDGRIWGAHGHDVWVSDAVAGPWLHRPVRLPDDESITDIFPVEGGVLWLTTGFGVAGGGLYRSVDDGVHWTRLSVATT